jgi:hypothetical protein
VLDLFGHVHRRVHEPVWVFLEHSNLVLVAPVFAERRVECIRSVYLDSCILSKLDAQLNTYFWLVLTVNAHMLINTYSRDSSAT